MIKKIKMKVLMERKNYFYERPHPIKTIQKSVYLTVDFYMVFMGYGRVYVSNFIVVLVRVNI